MISIHNFFMKIWVNLCGFCPGFFPGNQAKYAQDVDGLSRSSLAQVGCPLVRDDPHASTGGLVAIETGVYHGKMEVLMGKP
jgi:hypothetical protein